MRGTLPPVARGPLPITAIRLQVPGLPVIGETDVEDGLQSPLEERVLHRRDHLDPTIEVAWHPIGGAEEVLRRSIVSEHPDP